MFYCFMATFLFLLVDPRARRQEKAPNIFFVYILGHAAMKNGYNGIKQFF